jgi:hypothetical protein
MDERKNVLIINIHGGFPSSMIEKAFTQLSTLRDIKEKSDMYTRVYPTNVSAGPSLHDIIMDAPLGSMIDSVWHDEWCYVRKPSRSLFHIFKQNGYSTNLFGAFGLDKKLDPHVNMNNYPGTLQKSLQFYGVDDFEAQDAAFTCQMAFAHDREVISRACNFFQDRDNKSEFQFTMINLLGCQDIHKCNFQQEQHEETTVPSISLQHIDEWSNQGLFSNVKYTEENEKRHSCNVCNDNPRDANSDSSKIPAL